MVEAARPSMMSKENQQSSGNELQPTVRAFCCADIP